MSSNLEDLYTLLEKISEEESGGGGGIVALLTIHSGYKVYASGTRGFESFFPFTPGNQEERDTAKATADKLGGETGSRVGFGIQIQAHMEGALSRGEPVTWSGDRFFNADGWTPAFKEVLMPSLRECGILSLPWKGWGRLGFKPDPYYLEKGEMTETDQAGNPRYKQVAYVVEVYASEQEAKAGVTATTTPTIPSGWTPDGNGWTVQNLVDSLDLIKGEAKTKAVDVIATEYDLSISDVLIALGVHNEDGAPPVLAKKYGVDVSSITAVRNLADKIPF